MADPSRFDHDQQLKDRQATDESLETERHAADDIAEGERAARVADLVRTRRADAELRLRGARRDIDDRVTRQAAILPQVSGMLEDVAASLSKAASSLGGAGTLPDRAEPVPHDHADDLPRAAEALADAAADVEAKADVAPPDQIASQLAEVADGMADVTSTLADERHDVDHRLHRERAVTDRIIGQEVEEATAAIADEVRAGQQQLRAERRTTDRHLAEEREHTNEALDHVVDLIALEESQHAAAERRAATRSEILRIVSHDLRGPLMAIGAAAALIQAHAPGGETGQRIVDWTLTIRRSVAMTERLIHDLLDAGSLENGTLSGSAQIESIHVKEENLQAHLLSPEFFDAEKHPVVSFSGDVIERDGDHVEIDGEITIKGISQPAKLTGTINGPAVDHFGATRVGLKLQTTVDRTRFYIKWNMPLPTGEPALSNDVTLKAELTLVAQEA